MKCLGLNVLVNSSQVSVRSNINIMPSGNKRVIPEIMVKKALRPANYPITLALLRLDKFSNARKGKGAL